MRKDAGINPNISSGNNSVKNKKSLIHFRGTMKNNFFTNNPGQAHHQDLHMTQSGVTLTLNHGESNSLLVNGD